MTDGTGKSAADAAVIDIVIVNWNSGIQLTECLASIARWHDGLVRSIIVVDNASRDGSADNLETHNMPTTVIRAGDNLGFGRACNLGAAHAAAPFLLFLNPDATLGPKALKTAVDFLTAPENRDVAVVGIKLLDAEGRVQHHTTSQATFSTIFTHEQRANQFDHVSNRRVHHVIGAFYLIRTDVFQTVNGFDERFFMYLEDLDLSDRVGKSGWQVHYLADATAFHRGGGVSEQVKARRLFYSLRSRLQYSFKHFGFAQAIGITIVSLVAEPGLRIARALTRRSAAEIGETLAAYRLLWSDLPLLIGEARADRRARKRQSASVAVDRLPPAAAD